MGQMNRFFFWLQVRSSIQRMFTSIVLLLCYCSFSQAKEFKIGLLIPYKTVASHVGNDFNKGENFAAAMTIAIQDLNSNPSILPGHNISFTWKDTKCDELLTIKHEFKLINSRISGIIGPGCSCKTAARNAAAFNLPMISYMCSNPELSNKKVFPTFARTFAVDSQVTPSVISLLKKFDWYRVAIIYENLTKWIDLKDGMKQQFKANRIKVAYESSTVVFAHYSKDMDERFRKMMSDIKKTARIVIFVTSFYMAREGIYIATRENMINGDFAFIVFELNQGYVKKRSFLSFLWFETDSVFRNRTVSQIINQKGFEAVLVLSVKAPSGAMYEKFKRRLRNTTKDPPFNSSAYAKEKYKGMTPPVFGAYLYDAVYQYGIALNKTLNLNETPTGQAIIAKMRDINYHSIQGYQVHLDSNGDAEYNLTLLRIKDNPLTKKKELVETGDFHIVTNNVTQRGVPVFVYRNNMTIVWPNNKPAPRDSPPCGFNNELCPDEPTEDNKTTIIAAVSGALAFLVLLFIANFYRHYKAERELQSRFWKIDYNELCFEHRRGSNTSLASTVMVSDQNFHKIVCESYALFGFRPVLSMDPSKTYR